LLDKRFEVHALRRLAARLTGVMLLTVALAMPVASVDAHAAAHLASPVDATQHHHHDEHGGVVIDHDHGDRSAPDARGDADEDGGHAHMPAQAVGFEAPAVSEVATPVRSPALTRVEPSADRPPPDIGPLPHNRPPRFA
jgi:hypothetical protein